MTEQFNTGEPSISETLVRMHGELEWLKNFIRLHGDGRDKPPHDDAITEMQEYIERAAARLSTPPPSTIADGSL